MSCRRLCCAAVAGAALTMIGFSLAYAQEIDDLQVCKAAAAAFEPYAANSDDGDVETARGMVAQGLADCASGKLKEGLETINLATAAISDGKQGSHKRE
jgi:hypothetical protein